MSINVGAVVVVIVW